NQAGAEGIDRNVGPVGGQVDGEQDQPEPGVVALDGRVASLGRGQMGAIKTGHSGASGERGGGRILTTESQRAQSNPLPWAVGFLCVFRSAVSVILWLISRLNPRPMPVCRFALPRGVQPDRY